MEKSQASSLAAVDSDSLEALQSQHEILEKRLNELDRHLALTPDEAIERARIKKEKLRIKDRMLALL